MVNLTKLAEAVPDVGTEAWAAQASYSEILAEYGEDYDQYLNDLDGAIEVAGMSFDACEIVKQLDPEAYREGLFDYVEGLLEEDDD